MGSDRAGKIIHFVQIGLAIAIILAIFSFISASEFLAIIASIDLRFFLLALACYFCNNLLMALRLKRLLAHQGRKIRFKFAFWAHMAGMALSDFTPLRSGYLYTAVVLDKRGVPLETGTATITSTYIYDLLFKISIALLGLWYLYATLISPGLFAVTVVFVTSIAVILAFYFLALYPPRMVRHFAEKWRLGSKLLAIGEEGRKIQQFVPFILCIALLGWLLRGLQWFFVGMSLHVVFRAPYDAFFLSPLLTLFSLVPLTPAGLGIQETAIITFFSLIGIPIALSATFALVVRGGEILVDACGIKGFFVRSQDESALKAHYQAFPGDIDEKAYNSNLLVQRYFQRRKTEMIEKSLDSRGGVLLDLGCGSGVQIAAVRREYKGEVIGIDLNRNALLYARGKNIPGASFILANVHHLPIREGSVNQVICSELIEHLPRPEAVIGEIRRVLVPGGEVVITTPNERSIWGLYELLWDVFGHGRNYGETHLRFFSVPELSSLFSDFTSRSSRTIFFLSPVFALTNSPAFLRAGLKIDEFFERWGWGVSIVFHARK
ncbi:MAG: flippase-like domain-containing protein [Methanolinea sp.]|nr:flippase-like domain-containing protein [Methanolinea sp.]